MPSSRAILRNAQISPRKTRLVADLVRGKPVSRALQILDFSDKRAAVFLGKVLRSALANAGVDADPDRLVLSKVMINEGFRSKVLFARPRGQGAVMARPHCHMEIELSESAGVLPTEAPVDPGAPAPGTSPQPVEAT